MKTALIYPPTSDPTAPYPAIPALSGFLRARGLEVAAVDANLEAWEWLLTEERLVKIRDKLEDRLGRLEKRPFLNHAEQLTYAALWKARGDARDAPKNIVSALETFRGENESDFFDPGEYGAAVASLDGAFRAIGAAYAPLLIDFTAYRTPFSMLDAREIERGANARTNPFFEYFEGPLCERVAAVNPDIVGLSVAFPGQLEQAFAVAYALKKKLPDVHFTAGGPAMTQLFLRLDADERAKALGPFDTIVLFEGEQALLELVCALERGERPRGIIRGGHAGSLRELPAPDFDGLLLGRYFSPSLVLPYDPSRGCYHGRCAFCHYGLAEHGAAPYRERPAEKVAEDIFSLASRHGARVFYLSEDTIAPRHLSRIASELRNSNGGLRLATDIRPEPALTAEACRAWADGGLLAAAVGIESASPRILARIGKGLGLDDCGRAIDNLARAGVSVEAMCFTDFPTETKSEALETIRFLERRADRIALFMCGVFELVFGSAVARDPASFGISRTWTVAGDSFRSALFYEELAGKTEAERKSVDAALARVSRLFAMRQYPFAGSLSTAHSLLWFDKYGPKAFHADAIPTRFAKRPRRAKRYETFANFDVERIASISDSAESRIWDHLVHKDRAVSRKAYKALSDALPAAAPSRRKVEFAADFPPRRIRQSSRKKGKKKQA